MEKENLFLNWNWRFEKRVVYQMGKTKNIKLKEGERNEVKSLLTFWKMPKEIKEEKPEKNYYII